MPLDEVQEMREKLIGHLMPYLREALKHGDVYGEKAFSIIADYAAGLITRSEAEERLRRLLASVRGAKGRESR